MDALDERLHTALVGGIRRADELIVRDRETVPHLLERGSHAVDEGLRRDTSLVGSLTHLLPVLVHPHEKVHVIAGEAAIASNDIGSDFLERVTEMWVPVRVIDCSGEEESGQVMSCGTNA